MDLDGEETSDTLYGSTQDHANQPHTPSGSPPRLDATLNTPELNRRQPETARGLVTPEFVVAAARALEAMAEATRMMVELVRPE